MIVSFGLCNVITRLTAMKIIKKFVNNNSCIMNALIARFSKKAPLSF